MLKKTKERIRKEKRKKRFIFLLWRLPEGINIVKT